MTTAAQVVLSEAGKESSGQGRPRSVLSAVLNTFGQLILLQRQKHQHKAASSQHILALNLLTSRALKRRAMVCPV